MRRILHIALGTFELAAAGLLVVVGLLLPSRADVHSSFSRAEELTGETVAQVDFLRGQLDQVNGAQFGGLREASDGLGSIADGMEAWAKALHPDMIAHLRKGTRDLAGFLKESGGAAERAAAEMERAVKPFSTHAEELSQLLKVAPPDMKAAKEIHDSLSRFGEGLDKMSFLISADRLKTMREGFAGMEQSLDTGAGQVEKLSGYTYPVIKFNGLKPEIDEKAFWPEGDKIADGMRKGAKAMREANKEFESQAANLPVIQRSIDDSRKTVKSLNAMLERAVSNQDKLDNVLKKLPETTAELAVRLPELMKDFQKVLRETERLKELSVGLGQAQEVLASAEESWPRARAGLLRAAVDLRKLQARIESNTESPRERMQQQEQSLNNLSGNLQQVRQTLPGTSATVADIVTALRWLLWVVAGVLVLHGASVLGGSFRATPKVLA